GWKELELALLYMRKLLESSTDIRMKVEIPQDTKLVEPLHEACIWRQTRGTATETLGAENKAESTEKFQLQFTNLPFCFLKYFINPMLSYL
ncbi:unnamed protein product, partial [Lactuca virosa]